MPCLKIYGYVCHCSQNAFCRADRGINNLVLVWANDAALAKFGPPCQNAAPCGLKPIHRLAEDRKRKSLDLLDEGVVRMLFPTSCIKYQGDLQSTDVCNTAHSHGLPFPHASSLQPKLKLPQGSGFWPSQTHYIKWMAAKHSCASEACKIQMRCR